MGYNIPFKWKVANATKWRVYFSVIRDGMSTMLDRSLCRQLECCEFPLKYHSFCVTKNSVYK
jgi:hypothetical protein